MNIVHCMNANTSSNKITSQCSEGKITITVPNSLILEVHKTHQETGQSLLSVFNKCLPDYYGEVIGKRVENLLYSTCCKTAKEYRKGKGKKKYDQLSKCHTFTIKPEEIKPLEPINETATKQCNRLTSKLQEAESFTKRLMNKCIELQTELFEANKVKLQLKKTLQRHEEKTKKHSQTEERLREAETTVEQLGLQVWKRSARLFENPNKKVHEICRRRKTTVLKTVADLVSSATWFLDSYGLDLTSMTMKDKNNEQYIVDCLTNAVRCSVSPDLFVNSCYKDLSSAALLALRNVVLLLDENCVSNNFWQQLLALKIVAWPSIRLISECREETTLNVNITRTPGNFPGAQVSFIEDLQQRLAEVLQHGNESRTGIQKTMVAPVTIKIEGDGAQVGRNTNFVSIHYVIITNNDNVQSHKARSTLLITKGPEVYQEIRAAASILSEEINSVIQRGYIEVGRSKVPLNIVLGGDMKFLLIVMGMKQATSNYPCVLCRIHKDEKGESHYDSKHFNCPPMLRSLDEMKLDAMTDNFGCRYNPLFNIEPKNIIFDVLHLRMRIFERLIENLIIEVLERDETLYVTTAVSRKDSYLNKLLHIIHNCGLKRFDVWQDEHLNLNWSDLNGTQIELLCNKLPDKLATNSDLLHCSSKTAVTTLWKECHEIILKVSAKEESPNLDDLQNRAVSWLTLFNDLGTIRGGYGKSRVTPYMHVFAYHLVHQRREFGPLTIYSSQGLEKKNDIIKSIYIRHCSRWNATRETLLVLKRIDLLHRYRRKPRSYEKADTIYWNEGGIVSSRKRRNKESDDCKIPYKKPTVNEMTLVELREQCAEVTGKKVMSKDIDKMRMICTEFVDMMNKSTKQSLVSVSPEMAVTELNSKCTEEFTVNSANTDNIPSASHTSLSSWNSPELDQSDSGIQHFGTTGNANSGQA